MPKLNRQRSAGEIAKCQSALFIRAWNTLCNRNVSRIKGQRFTDTDVKAVLAFWLINNYHQLAENIAAAARNNGESTQTAIVPMVEDTVPSNKRTTTESPPRDAQGRFKKK